MLAATRQPVRVRSSAGPMVPTTLAPGAVAGGAATPSPGTYRPPTTLAPGAADAARAAASEGTPAMAWDGTEVFGIGAASFLLGLGASLLVKSF
jgi:transcription elongation factor